jgi:hypothetical protein
LSALGVTVQELSSRALLLRDPNEIIIALANDAGVYKTVGRVARSDAPPLHRRDGTGKELVATFSIARRTTGLQARQVIAARPCRNPSSRANSLATT